MAGLHIGDNGTKPVILIADPEDYPHYLPMSGVGLEFHHYPLDTSSILIQETDCDILVIDSGTDGERGLSILHEIKTLRPDLMVIFITDAVSHELTVTAFRLGVRDYFIKPVSCQILKETIERLLELKSRPRGNGQRAIEPPPQGGHEYEYIPEGLLRVITYAEKHMSEDLSIDRLADIAGISKFHFCRTFKKTMGISPKGYLASRRIEKAKELLRSNVPVSLTALATGFNDLSSFSRLFRKLTGQCPSTFKKNHASE